MARKVLASSIMSMVGFALGAADLTVELGSPYEATTDETYGTVAASDAILIGSGVTFQATTYNLAANAVPGEDGVVHAVEIAAGGAFVPDAANNSNSATGRITVAGANAKIKKRTNSWYSSLFLKGNFEIADPDGYGLTVNLPGTWNGGQFNAAGVGCAFRGREMLRLRLAGQLSLGRV